MIDTTAAAVEDPGVLELLLDLARQARPPTSGRRVPAGGVLDRVLATTGLGAALDLSDLRAALDDLDLPSPDALR